MSIAATFLILVALILVLVGCAFGHMLLDERSRADKLIASNNRLRRQLQREQLNRANIEWTE